MKKYEWKVRSVNEKAIDVFALSLQKILNDFEEEGFDVERIDHRIDGNIYANVAVVVGKKAMPIRYPRQAAGEMP